MSNTCCILFCLSLPPESYLRYLCLFTYSNVQHMLYFVLFVFTSSLIYVICVCLPIVMSNTCCILFCLSLPPESYLRYLCLFTYSNVQHMLYFVLFVFVLCALCCQFLWIVHFWLSLWYSVACIYIIFGYLSSDEYLLTDWMFCLIWAFKFFVSV
jgi:hypothetical protein